MGLYRTVFCILSCRRCGCAYAAGIQFKTGLDGLQQYSVGQVVTDQPRQTEYEGVVGAFCPSCQARWESEHGSACGSEEARPYEGLSRRAQRRQANEPRDVVEFQRRVAAELVRRGWPADLVNGACYEPYLAGVVRIDAQGRLSWSGPS